MDSIPLVVDLDGTLIHTDMLYESMLGALRDKPLLNALKIFFFIFRGKAFLKQCLARISNFSVANLPYNQEFLDWLKEEYAKGRKLILCTATNQRIATAIADYLGIFSEVMASDGVTNLKDQQKADALVQRFGKQGFDYAGNSQADLSVWSKARHAILVNVTTSVKQQTVSLGKTEKIFSSTQRTVHNLQKVLRTHQWLKNILVFIPLLASHQITHFNLWFSLLFAFIAFSMCASSVYIANDLLDLEHDRQHPNKCKRPFAAGIVPVWLGLILAPLLLVGSLLIAKVIGSAFIFCLVCYFIVSCAYSLRLKRLVIIDCITLAFLYTLRIIAGTVAVAFAFSFWLLAFSIFLFLSLAFVKRYAELCSSNSKAKKKISGRGYYPEDASLVQIFGITAAYASALVLALYLNSAAVIKLYYTPEFIWGAVPLLLFWTSWVWLRAHRGEMHDDPLIFAIKDKVSLITGFLFMLVLLLGTENWSWL